MKNDVLSPWEPEEERKIAARTVVIGETLHWNGNDAIYRQQSLHHTVSTFAITYIALLPFLSTDEAERLGPQSLPSQPPSGANAGYAAPRRRTPARTWKKLARVATFLLDPLLLRHGRRAVNFEARGELIWASHRAPRDAARPSVHPVIIISPLTRQQQIQRLEIIPHLQPTDPLLQHLVLALQAKRAAESAAQRCYAEALTNALAVHFLKRYAAAHQTEGAVPSGLSPHKLRRATAYIDEHLEHELSLTKIAAVAHMSLAHFARLFRQDTGMTPHQFVLCRRIDRARQLLANTELPLCEISHRVGFADQSHFIAVFRKHVGLTPRLYRHHASGTSVET